MSRDAIDSSIIEHSEQARRELSLTIDALDKAVVSVPPLQALADFTLYGLMTRAGHDPEVDTPNPVLQFHVELLQAFVLRHEFCDFAADVMVPKQFEEIHRLIRQAADNFTARTFGDSIRARGDPQKATEIYLRDAIRVETMAVRNWGYAPQIRRIIRELLNPLEPTIESTIGFRITSLFDAFDSLFKHRERVINDHRLKLRPIRKTRSVADALLVYQQIGIGPSFELAELQAAESHQSLSLRDIQFFLMSEATNSVSSSFYTFTCDDIVASFPQSVDRERLRKGLDLLSFSFGALKDRDPEHFLWAIRYGSVRSFVSQMAHISVRYLE